MELALITPVREIEYTKLLPGRFCIASVATKHSAYKEYFKNAAVDGYPVMLDNGAFESKGVGLTSVELWDLAMELSPKVLIVPDIFGGNGAESYAMSREFARSHPNLTKGAPEFMVVCQCAPKQDPEEFWALLSEAIEDKYFSWIGIPRVAIHNAFSKFTGTDDQELNRFYFHCEAVRRGVVDALLKRDKKAHFLGVGDRIHMLQHYWWVASADTASLFWQATFRNQVTLNGVLQTDIPRPKDYYIRIYDPPIVWEETLKWNCAQAAIWAARADVLRSQVLGKLYT
jgi:hypothetical protein